MSDFPVLFKADLFSRTFQESPLNSRTFQACGNPDNLPVEFLPKNLICLVDVLVDLSLHKAPSPMCLLCYNVAHVFIQNHENLNLYIVKNDLIVFL